VHPHRMADLFDLFRALTMGVYIVGVTDGSERDAFTAASIAHISYQPLLLSMAVNPQHASYRLLLAGKGWTVSVLGSDQIELARRFGTGGQGWDKMTGVKWASASSGAPYLEHGIAYFDCRLTADYPAGDHRLVVGHVIGGAILSHETSTKPLIYADTGNLDKSAALYPHHFD
jgi:flavin reductase (DIM6/NTAB) family NADH-FMN oxidoreductase RutF